MCLDVENLSVFSLGGPCVLRCVPVVLVRSGSSGYQPCDEWYTPLQRKEVFETV